MARVELDGSKVSSVAEDVGGFAGRQIRPREHEASGGWQDLLKQTPMEWERFRLVRAAAAA